MRYWNRVENRVERNRHHLLSTYDSLRKIRCSLLRYLSMYLVQPSLSKRKFTRDFWSVKRRSSLEDLVKGLNCMNMGKNAKHGWALRESVLPLTFASRAVASSNLLFFLFPFFFPFFFCTFARSIAKAWIHVTRVLKRIYIYIIVWLYNNEFQRGCLKTFLFSLLRWRNFYRQGGRSVKISRR